MSEHSQQAFLDSCCRCCPCRVLQCTDAVNDSIDIDTYVSHNHAVIFEADILYAEEDSLSVVRHGCIRIGSLPMPDNNDLCVRRGEEQEVALWWSSQSSSLASYLGQQKLCLGPAAAEWWRLSPSFSVKALLVPIDCSGTLMALLGQAWQSAWKHICISSSEVEITERFWHLATYLCLRNGAWHYVSLLNDLKGWPSSSILRQYVLNLMQKHTAVSCSAEQGSFGSWISNSLVDSLDIRKTPNRKASCSNASCLTDRPAPPCMKLSGLKRSKAS